MTTFHNYYTDESLKKHKNYLKEILFYLRKHPNEDNLYQLSDDFQDVLDIEDPLYKRVEDFSNEDIFSEKFIELFIKIRTNNLMNPIEFHDYFVEKFPQWKDIYYYDDDELDLKE